MRKVIACSLLFIGLVLLSFGIYLSTKFKNIEIELGTSITNDQFVSYGTTNNFQIDLKNVNNNKVGEYPVLLKCLFVEYYLNVNVVDKTPPLLEVHDVYKSLNYVVDVNDFIVNVSDKSEYEVSYYGDIDTSKYGEYSVDISAKDIYNNSESKTAKLSIGWVKNEYSIEVGNIIKVEDLVYDEIDKDTISPKDLDEINKKEAGTYYLDSIRNDVVIKIKIEKIPDATPPELVLKDITIYTGKKINSVNDFIKKATDKSGKVDLKMLSTINYNKIGEQKITIEATDIYGNKTTKEATLKIIKDTVGPKISGLTKLTVNKNTEINYRNGVSSYDENTGKCDFDFDSSNVDTSKYGTYYAIYTSTDALGNKTTTKRIIVVNHDKNDTDELLKKIADTLSSDAEKIRDYVRKNVSYNTNWGGDDPIWYGLTNKVGNCFVHANIFDALLRLKGFETELIWTTNKTHYWNMVKLNGKWVHMDSTPTQLHMRYSIMNDKTRKETLYGRDWDRNSWPKAE